MTTAHIFYVPIIFFVGLFVGFFMGKRASEAELQAKRRRNRRRKAIQEQEASPAEPSAENASS